MTSRVAVTSRRAGSRPASTTLRCRWVLPLAGPLQENGWVQIAAGMIAAVGRGTPPGADVVDLGDAILLPGLVNAHTHLEFSDRREPLGTTGGLPDWIGRVVAERRRLAAGGSDAARSTAAIRRGLAESAAAGVTTIGEIATTCPADAYVGPGPAVRVFREGLGLRPAAVAAVGRGVARDLDRLASLGLAGGVSPHAPYSVAAPLGRRLLVEATRRRLPVAMHLLESLEEEDLLRGGGGAFRRLLEDLGAWDPTAPPALLPPADWIGLLARARRAIVVHATHVGRDRAALARLSRHRDRLAVVVCPRTARAMSGSLPPLARLREAGLRVAIGTDSRASSPDLSLLAECRALVDGGLASPEEALRMATTEAAWGLGLENRAGRIAVGRPADLAILRPSAPPPEGPYAAVFDPTTAVVATVRRGRVLAGSLA